MAFSILTSFLALYQDDTPANPAGPADTTPQANDVDSAAAAVTGTGVEDHPTVTELTTRAINYLEDTIEQTPWTGWILLFCGILGGLIAGRIAQVMLRRLSDLLKSRGWVARGSLVNYLSGPINFGLFALGLAVGFTGIVLDPEVSRVVHNGIGLMYVLALAWFLYNLVDIVELGIRKVTDDDTIVQLIRKALRIFVLIIFGLFIAENFFGASISAWLAGLGLAGLAVSLAAQGPIKNLFGSVTVVLDRPFGLGDRIKFADKDGIVEVMGFRSTKLRTLEGHLVTIPNSKLIEDVVENITARPYIRRKLDVTITYDTPPQKIEQAIQILKDLVAESFMVAAYDMEKFPPRVAFNTLNADSLNILVMYWYQLNVEGRDFWTFNEQAQQFNLKLIRAFNEAGIDFAFPSQTVYLAGDANRHLSVNLTRDSVQFTGASG